LRILAVDIGTGTQDIFLFDSRFAVENGIKMVMPSATMLIHQKIKQATRAGKPILLTGEIMGGGPSSWAAEAHLKSGLPVYATPAAARSFNDDLEVVQKMGIRIIAEEDEKGLSSDIVRIEMKDFNFEMIRSAMANFGVTLDDLSAVAVAVFDHGNAPREVSDRKFRFDYLDSRIKKENRLSAFAYPSGKIPSEMTRMQAVANTCSNIPCPVVIMDTAPAAILGATFDPLVSSRHRKLVANIGNLHTLAFRLGPSGIEGVFEHHTGLLDREKLDSLLISFSNGTLTNDVIFNDHGHGALVLSNEVFPLDDKGFNIVVTGPRRDLLRGSKLKPYYAVPFGDMMLSGCFGLLAATADILPKFTSEIHAALKGKNSNKAPWEIE
jgi:uncharacterized protein (DUF1786 family)